MKNQNSINRPTAWVNRIVGIVYRRIIGEEMSLEARSFLKDLSFVTLGSGIMTLLTFIFGILGGRILGPEQYGKFILIQSSQDLFRIPMILGFSAAMVRYLSEKNDPDRHIKIANTTFILVLIYTVATTLVLFLFRAQISNLLAISIDLFYFALATAVLDVLYNVATSTQRGIGKMRVFALIQPALGIILLGGFLIFIFNNEKSFRAMAYPQMIGFGVCGILAMISLGRRFFHFVFDRSWASVLARYAFFAFIAGLSSALYTNMGKFLIGRYMTDADVGIYNAYYSPTINVASVLFITFNLVFFPAASKYKDKASILKKMDRLVPYLFLLGMPLVFILEFVILKLYGEKYPINLMLMVVFAVAAILIMYYGIYSTVFNSEGLKGIKLTNISVGTIALLDIILSILLIPRLGLLGAVSAIALSFFAGIMCLRVLRRKLV